MSKISKTNEQSKHHFIPFRKGDIVEMCLQEGSLSGQEEAFRQLQHVLESIFHFEFHQLSERLKTAYAPLDPDVDTRLVKTGAPSSQTEFIACLKELLEKANYAAVTEQDLKHAMSESSMFKIRLEVDFEEFSDVLLFCRGVSTRRETVFRFAGRFPKEIEFINYERVMIYIRFRDDYAQQDNPLPSNKPGATMLKLFRNVPRADMEMLFPNTRIRMRLLDKLLIGVPALISGGIIVTTKLATSLLLLGSLLGFWLGFNAQPVELNKTALTILLVGVATLGGYIWKQFSAFKNRKIQFMQSLTQNLYFKNLDNNAGVFHRLINDAEEEECKEATLAYYFLLIADQTLSKSELDEKIEAWFEAKWDCAINFDIEDGLQKLQTLGLVNESDGLFTAISLSAATDKLDQRWDDYFK